MKTIPANRDGYAKSWVVEIDAKDIMVNQMAGGTCFTHRRLEFNDPDGESDGLVAEFCMDSVELLLGEEWVAATPRVIMCVEQPDSKPMLTTEEMLSMVDVLTNLCNASSVLWGLTVTGGAHYAVSNINNYKYENRIRRGHG